MLVTIFISLAIVAALLILLWFLRGVMLTPVHIGKGEDICVVITVEAAAPELEQTVDALLWLIENGTLPACIRIVDAGMDEETRQIAKLLEKRFMRVTFIERAKEAQ